MRGTAGIIRITIDRDNWTMNVRYDPDRITVEGIRRALDAATDAVDAEH